MKSKQKFINAPLIISQPVPKKVPKVDFDALKSAIEDCVFKAQKGDEVILRRDHLTNDKKRLYLCTVIDVRENGEVLMYNETLQQEVSFNVKSPMNVRLLP